MTRDFLLAQCYFRYKGPRFLLSHPNDSSRGIKSLAEGDSAVSMVFEPETFRLSSMYLNHYSTAPPVRVVGLQGVTGALTDIISPIVVSGDGAMALALVRG